MEKSEKNLQPKVEVSEKDLAQKQAKKMMRDIYRVQRTGKVGAENNVETAHIWRDTDFYFSVVFQTSAQKYEFLEQLSKRAKLGIDQIKSGDEVVQIINGIKLAKSLGIELKEYKCNDYVYPDLELAKLILDGEDY